MEHDLLPTSKEIRRQLKDAVKINEIKYLEKAYKPIAFAGISKKLEWHDRQVKKARKKFDKAMFEKNMFEKKINDKINKFKNMAKETQ